MTLKDDCSLSEFANLPTAQVSSSVNSCIDELTTVQKKVDSAVQKAMKARESSEKAKAVILHWYKIGDKAEAIEALQDAMVDVSDVQGDQSDAIRLLLEYQENVASGMKFLFMLGASNMAANRTVVREVEMRLKNASEKEIGEMARNELRAVMAQLKAQLDVQERQERLVQDQKAVKARLQATRESVDRLSARESAQDRLLQERVKADKKQDAELKRQAEKDVEHDKRINENREDIDTLQKGVVAQGKAIEEHSRNDLKQDAELKRQAEKDREHDELIAANRKNIDANAQLIALIKEILAKHRHEIAGVKVAHGTSKVLMTISVISLIVSLLSIGLVVYTMCQ